MRCRHSFFPYVERLLRIIDNSIGKIQGRYVLRSLRNMVSNVYDLNIFHQCSSEYLYLQQNCLVKIVFYLEIVTEA